jgi:hypothetical protein
MKPATLEIDRSASSGAAPSHQIPCRSSFRVAIWLALTFFADCLPDQRSVHAMDLDLLSMGVRTRVGEKRVLGEVAPESFRGHDLVASIRLPWQRYSASGWGIGTRTLASAGILQGAGKTALVASLTPVLALGSEDGRFTVDAGIGLALISETRFAQQDFGGPLQFSLTAGVGVPLYRQVGVGYRFMHYSDAGLHGPNTIGVDFHMIECIYRF